MDRFTLYQQVKENVPIALPQMISALDLIEQQPAEHQEGLKAALGLDGTTPQLSKRSQSRARTEDLEIGVGRPARSSAS